LLRSTLKEFALSKAAYETVPGEDVNLCGYDDETNCHVDEMIKMGAQQQDDLVNILNAAASHPVDLDLARVFNEAFLSLVRASYWRQIDRRVLPPGSREADVLLHSVNDCLSYPKPKLVDFAWLCDFLMESKMGGAPIISRDDNVIQSIQYLSDAMDKHESKTVTKYTLGPAIVVKFVNSLPFAVVMASTIALNGIYILVEEKERQTLGSDSKGWLAMELLFTIMFVFEAVIKIVALRVGYFAQSWNVFDVFLAVFGVFGCVTDMLSQDYDKDSAGGTNEARIIRLTRVLKVARLLRLFRLFNMAQILYMKMDKHELCLTNGEYMKKFTALTAFIKAHLHAQRDLSQILIPTRKPPRGAGVDTDGQEVGIGVRQEEPLELIASRAAYDMSKIAPELANCLLESLTSVYIASVLAVRALNAVANKDTLVQIHEVRESWDIAMEMEELVLQAQAKGVISASDAESMTHPFHHHIAHCNHIMSKALLGFDMSSELKQELSDDEHHGHGDTHKVVPA